MNVAIQVRHTIQKEFASTLKKQSTTTLLDFPFSKKTYIHKIPSLNPLLLHKENWAFLHEILFKEADDTNVSVKTLPREEKLPSIFTPCITLNEEIFCSEVNQVYGVTIKVSGNEKINAVMKCILLQKDTKNTSIRLCQEFQNQHSLAIDPCWIEPIAHSRVYPEHFYGCVCLYVDDRSSWYCCYFMPRYPGTLLEYVESIHYKSVEKKCTMVRDLLAQFFFCTLPRSKKSFLVSHNDAKINNVMYIPTKEKYMYVKVAVNKNEHRTLAIPTHGMELLLIDFGWSSLSTSQGQFCSSEPFYIFPHAQLWSSTTDIIQFSQSLRQELLENKIVSTKLEKEKTLWDSTFIMLQSLCCENDDIHYRMYEEVDGKHWKDLFYYEIPTRKTIKHFSTFITNSIARYGYNEPLPKESKILCFDLYSFVQ